MRGLIKSLCFLLVLVPTLVLAQGFPPLIVEEIDGSPTGVTTKIKVSNTTLSRSGTVATITIGGGSQTPWTSDINGSTFNLTTTGTINATQLQVAGVNVSTSTYTNATAYNATGWTKSGNWVNTTVAGDNVSIGGGTLGAGAITGTSFIIGANTLNTTEWAFLDGQNQAVKTTSTPGFTRLGIGILADASVPFKVSAAGISLAGTGYYNYWVQDGAATNRGFIFGYDTSGQIGVIAPAGVSGQLGFWSHNGTAWAERIRFDQYGNVGIGTATPATILDVNGVINATGGNSTYWNAKGTSNVTIADVVALANLTNYYNKTETVALTVLTNFYNKTDMATLSLNASNLGSGTVAVARGGTGAANFDNLIALTTNTTGNYVASVATTAPLTGGAAGSEGAALTIVIPKATSSADGYLNLTDWSTFNAKLAVGATGGSLTAVNAANLTNLLGDLATTGPITGAANNIFPGANGAKATIAINQSSATVDGYLSAINWTTFNAKQGALTNSAGLASALNDETGTGLSVFSTSPAFTTPNIGAATGTSLNLTGGTGVSSFTGPNNDTTVTISINTTSAEITAADTFVSFNSTDGQIGSIAGTAVSGVIIYNTFLGGHFTEIEGEIPQIGQVLEITGNVMEKPSHLAKSRICRTPGSNKVYGVYAGQNKEGKHTTLGLGAGTVLAVGDIEPGDLLEADGEGYARKQTCPDCEEGVSIRLDNFILSSTLGKAVQSHRGNKPSMIGVILYAG